jgi:uncharacterized membrane-anchored protein YhcB (DUF1043 family)
MTDDFSTDFPQDIGDEYDTLESGLNDTQNEVDNTLDWENDVDTTEQQELQAIESLSEIEELNSNTWSELNESERLETAQEIETTMAEIQGRPPMEVQLDENLELCGYYDGQRIHVSDWSLSNNDPKELVDTIIHEGRHAYQHYAVQNPGFHPNENEVATWVENFSDYTEFKDDPEEYRNQPVEADAWDYGNAIADGLYEK